MIIIIFFVFLVITMGCEVATIVYLINDFQKGGYLDDVSRSASKISKK